MNIPKIIGRREYETLMGDNRNLLTKCEQLENEITALKDMSKDVMEEKANYDAKVAALKEENEKAIAEHNTAMATLKADGEKETAAIKAEHDKVVASLKADIERANTSSEKKAIATLAKIGVQEEQLPKQVSTPQTPEDIENTFKRLSGEEQQKFYQANKEVILQRAGLNK